MPASAAETTAVGEGPGAAVGEEATVGTDPALCGGIETGGWLAGTVGAAEVQAITRRDDAADNATIDRWRDIGLIAPTQKGSRRDDKRGARNLHRS